MSPAPSNRFQGWVVMSPVLSNRFQGRVVMSPAPKNPSAINMGRV